jgi:CRP-like cAMP-binding protein
VNDTSTQIRKAAESYFGVELTDESLGEFVVCEIGGGDWLFHQGEIGSSLFLLVRGRLHVLRETAELESPQLLGEVVPGESVGEVGLG